MIYERDLIAERDKNKKLHSSVVKWWNDYSYVERLNQQIAEANAMYQAQMAAMAASQIEDSDYNATTGSYSGSYGKNADLLSDDEKNQVSDILANNNDSIADLINQNQKM